MSLTIVMYHYVRALEATPYPEIKGLHTRHFQAQIAYIKQHYQVIPPAQFVAFLTEGEPLPPCAALLTFDDGYSEHYETVHPILQREDLTACFFPVVQAVMEHRVLNVNKIHFLLAVIRHPHDVIQRIYQALDDHRAQVQLDANEVYWERYARAGKWDPPEIMFIKRMLQRGLPSPVRETLTGELFRHFVTEDETAFAQELYVSLPQLREMQAAGHLIGAHGYSHGWLNTLSPEEQRFEVEQSVQFLETVSHAPVKQWVMCYPYGEYDQSLIDIQRAAGAVAGLTTQVGIAHPGQDNVMKLPRLDTNHLPRDAAAIPNEWTQQA